MNESSSATALGHAVQNRSLDLTLDDLQFLYSIDPHGAKEYVTGIPGYTQKEKEHKKELREELYKLLTGEEIQYYKHKWSNWEKTDNPKGDIWGTVKSNADFALEVNDKIPDDLLSVVKPITYTAATFYGLNTLGVFLEGVSIYGFRMASGLATNGMLREMIADYNSTLGATDADEQFILNALNSTDKDEELLEGMDNPDFRKKLDYLFGEATGNTHNIDRTTGMKNELANKMGIYDTPDNRSFIMDKLTESYYDQNSIVSVEPMSYVAKELPGKPVVNWTGTTRETFIMGPERGAVFQTLWDGNVLKNIIVKGGKGPKSVLLEKILKLK
ncbi:hypothetical protein [Vallitalea sp.]|uniref:hypothetical protein n=1 Tax=Vallitalea sp. TaxID=1882829 RepID=UPI0025F1D17F|nr:hypothetical protein [Vallitalea sp.]MCT4687739.1 hypothetical protein [Vallitalea sp.]